MIETKNRTRDKFLHKIRYGQSNFFLAQDAFDKFPELNLDYKQLKLPIILFALFIISVCIGPFIGLSIAYIALLFGGVLLLANRNISDNILNSLPILDSLIFIISLFLIGGALEYSGILNKVTEYILSFTGSNEYLILLSIMLFMIQ